MKIKLLFVWAIALMCVACSESLNDATEVENDSNESIVEEIFEDVSTKDVQFKKIAKILSKAVSDYFMDCPILSIYSNTVNFYDNGCGNLRVIILPVTASYYSKIMNKNM